MDKTSIFESLDPWVVARACLRLSVFQSLNSASENKFFEHLFENKNNHKNNICSNLFENSYVFFRSWIIRLPRSLWKMVPVDAPFFPTAGRITDERLSDPAWSKSWSLVLDEYRGFNHYLLVVWNMFSPYIGNNIPNWLIFFRGVETTNQTQTHTYIYNEFNHHLQGFSEAMVIELPWIDQWCILAIPIMGNSSSRPTITLQFQ